MAFNAHEFRTSKALEPPTITVSREEVHPFRWSYRLAVALRRMLNRLPWVSVEVETKTYTGRLLSQPEWVAYADRMQEMDEAGKDWATQEVFLEEFLTDCGIPPSVVLSQPPAVYAEAVRDFLACQVRAAGGDPSLVQVMVPESPPGTDSPTGSRKTTKASGRSGTTSRSPSSSTATGPTSTGAGTSSPAGTSGGPETG